MSEQPKKARDIKDLKARLGRSGGPGTAPPGGVPAPAIPAPGGLPGPNGIPAPGSLPAPGAAPGPLPGMGSNPPTAPGTNPPMAPGAGHSSIPAPFSQPPAAPAAAAPAASADPFAAATNAAPVAQEIKLVMDGKDVTDEEVGRKSMGKVVIGLVVAGIVGVAVGWGVGSTARERQLQDMITKDARDIYGMVNTASQELDKAKGLIDQASKAAAAAKPDFKALEELRAMEKPFAAEAFARKHYKAMQPQTVDALFMYYNNVNLIWAKIQSITGRSLPKTAREELEKSAKEAASAQATQIGCVPFKSQNDLFACGLVKVDKSKTEGMVKVSSMGRSFDKSPYKGEDLTAKGGNYVILIDKARSQGVIGNAGNKFKRYVRDLVELKQLSDETSEVQGRLIKEIGNAIATL